MRDLVHKAAYGRERRAWYNERGLCPICGRVYKEPGRYACRDCIHKNELSRKKYDPDGSKTYALNKQRREKRIAEGLCIDCGTPVSKYKRCERCLAKRRESWRKWIINKKLDEQAKEARKSSL